MDQRCYGNTCAGLQTQKADISTKCEVDQAVKEPVEGCELNSSSWISLLATTDLCDAGLSELPGGLQVTYN
jgi:hypothetical protein